MLMKDILRAASLAAVLLAGSCECCNHAGLYIDLADAVVLAVGDEEIALPVHGQPGGERDITTSTSGVSWLGGAPRAIAIGTVLVTGLANYVHYGAHTQSLRLAWFDGPLDWSASSLRGPR